MIPERPTPSVQTSVETPDYTSLVEKFSTEGMVEITHGLPVSTGQQLFELLYTFLMTDVMKPISRFPIMAVRQPSGESRIFMLTSAKGKTDHYTLWTNLGQPPFEQVAFTTSLEQLLLSPNPNITRYLEVTDPSESPTDPPRVKWITVGGGSDFASFPVLNEEGVQAMRKIFQLPGIIQHGI